ncbi:MAG: ABC transporter permease [Defluviitaleaceae bacterium]|nr:ABC transporter permease [Defluviitaleaceae bacterium]
MRAIDTLSMCFRNLIKRKLRTFLTLLGVMIGTGSIIIMISLGLATDAQFAQMIEDMNLNMTEIQVFPQWGGTMWSPDGGMVEMTQRDITDESVERFTRIPGVRAATPLMTEHLMFRSGPYTMVTTVTGVKPEALGLMGYNLGYGRFLQEGGEFEAVFSVRSERGFFDASDRTVWNSPRQWDMSDDVETLVDIHNDSIRIYYDDSQFWNTRDWGWGGGMIEEDFGLDLEEDFAPVRSFEINIVGVIQPPEIELRWGGGTQIFMDIETLQHLNQLQDETRRRQREEDEWSPTFSAITGGPRQTYQDVRVRTASMDDTARVAEIIQEMGYQVWFPGDWINQQREMQRGMETLLAAIAAVSLVIAAINIANTMITSVTERTREIGVMKVIGASISDVRKLFLLESMVIGVLGGVLGIVLALGMSYAMNNFDIEFLNNLNMGAPIMANEGGGAVSLITPWLCGLALAVAGGIGLLSGYYPAWHATRLSALAAIRGD